MTYPGTGASVTTTETDEDLRSPIASGFGLLVAAGAMGTAIWLNYPAVTLLSAIVIATILAGRGWNALSLVGVRSERELGRSRAFPGDYIDIAITITNWKPLPLAWVRAEERVPSSLLPDHTPDGQSGICFSTPLRWYQSATYRSQLHCRRRGSFAIGPTSLVSGDVFGLFEKRARARGAAAARLLVYPKLIDIEELGLTSRNPLGNARDPSRLFEDASRPNGIRDYTPDTPFKNIAWAASARQGRLQAKTFETTTTLLASIFLAVDSFPVREDGDELFEFAVSATASLAHLLIDDGQSIGLYVNGVTTRDAGPIALAPRRGTDQAMAILEALAMLRHQSTMPLAKFLESATGRDYLGRGTIAVVAASLAEPAVARLSRLRRVGNPVTVLIAGTGPMPGGGLDGKRLRARGDLHRCAPQS